MRHLITFLFVGFICCANGMTTKTPSTTQNTIQKLISAYATTPKVVTFGDDTLSIVLDSTWHLTGTSGHTTQRKQAAFYLSKAHPSTYLAIQKLPAYGSTPQDVFDAWIMTLKQHNIINSAHYVYHSLPMLTFEVKSITQANSAQYTLGTITQIAPQSFYLVAFNTHQAILPSATRQQFLDHLHSIQRHPH